MTLDPQHIDHDGRQRMLGAVAAILSAFFVFVLGGAIVLGVWVKQRDANHVTLVPGELPQARPGPKAGTRTGAEATPPTKPRRTTAGTSSRTTTRKTRPKTVKPKVAKVAKPVTTTAVPTTTDTEIGEGLVMVVGAASRVRLMGSKGTFGPGTVPAGTYTIQATFEGGDPRMAGTIHVSNGDRLQLICAVSTQRCTRR
jgi:hypothetical protein